MKGRRDNLRRRKASRDPYRRYLVVCEGEVTEPRYLDQLRRRESLAVEVEFVCGLSPKTCAERAAERKRSGRKASRGAEADFDEIWVVFDRDTHENVPEAIEQANANGIHVAFSSPSFELWALLHFQAQNAHIERAEVRRLLRDEHMPGYHKELNYAAMRAGYQTAVARAEALRERNQPESPLVPGNPYTGVDKLVQRLLAEPRRPGK